MTQHETCLQEAARHILQTASGRQADRASLQIVWNFFFFCLSQCHGYLIISQGKRWVWSANKGCLNKLAPSHIIQAVGIVLGRQASTGREPTASLGMAWTPSLDRGFFFFFLNHVNDRYLNCCKLQNIKSEQPNDIFQSSTTAPQVKLLDKCSFSSVYLFVFTTFYLICVRVEEKLYSIGRLFPDIFVHYRIRGRTLEHDPVQICIHSR